MWGTMFSALSSEFLLAEPENQPPGHKGTKRAIKNLVSW
jgi:hypothetical protein